MHNVVRLLTIANDDLPSVEYRCEKLKREEASLIAGNRNSARTLQELSDQIKASLGVPHIFLGNIARNTRGLTLTIDGSNPSFIR